MISIFRGHIVSEEMNLIYLLNILKIFVISGYLVIRCCWNPANTTPRFNKIMYGTVIGVTSIAIVSTILVTIFETIRNLKDNNPDNDYLVYILIAACLFQSVLFAFYTMYFIKYMIWKEEGNVSYLVPI
eukprot:TRINITY_DN9948_c0_g1_i4.p1 TRINITY_DN9948_c0_g1~~TRINITY_DN9948_c0_g1_i4.p1  ORF type:complete len:129 (-),score=22.50 TRINITY_DN9948_c0_g1_i4:130-516(-)